MAQRTLPPIHPPVRLWRQYERRLRQHLLDPIANAMAKRIKEAADSYVAVQAAIAQYDAANAPSTVSDAEAWAKAMRDHHRKKFDTAIARHFGIRVMPLGSGMPWEQAIQAAIIANIDLIKTIPPRYHMALKNEIAKLVTDKPFDRKAISSALRKSYKIGGYNVRRIARDQTNKLIGKLTQEKQTYIGIEMYEWYTAMDERVREMHAQNHGLKFRWDKPPATGHPGEEIQCRCVALAVIDTSRHRRGALPSPATPPPPPSPSPPPVVPPVPRPQPSPQPSRSPPAPPRSKRELDTQIQNIEASPAEKSGDSWLRDFATYRWGQQEAQILDSDAFAKVKGKLLLRFVNKEAFVKPNIDGSFVGHGLYGNGQYFGTGSGGFRRVLNAYAKDGDGGWTYAAKLRDDAKVISLGDAFEKHSDFLYKLKKKGVEPSEFDVDRGRWLARQGYDAVVVHNEKYGDKFTYIIVLNQRKLVVDKSMLPDGEAADRLRTAGVGSAAWKKQMTTEMRKKYGTRIPNFDKGPGEL